MSNSVSQVERDLLISFLALELIPNIPALDTKALEATIKPLLPEILLMDLTPLGPNVTDESLNYIGQNVNGMGGPPKIQTILLRGCSYITGSGFDVFKTLPDLKTVNVANMPRLADETINNLIKTISGNNLETLFLNNNFQLTDQSLAVLPNNKIESIKEVDMSGTQITDATFNVLSQMPNLTTLNVNGCRGFTGAAIQKLQNLDNLRSLSFANNLQIDDTAILTLTKTSGSTTPVSQNLTSLNLNSCYQISDASITNILSDSKICGLDLAYTQITDKTIQIIEGLEGFSYLDVSGCRNIGISTLEGIHANFPKANIIS